jgi:competence protein ComEC
VRAIAAIPAIALLAGAATGLVVPEPPIVLAYILLSSSVAGAMFGWALRRPLFIAGSVALGFVTGGLLLSSVEWRRAWRPPLRVAFEELARSARAEAARQGRRLPEDDEAFAVVEGVLRSDGSVGGSGVSLSVAVDRVFYPNDPTHLTDPPNPTHAPAVAGASKAAGGLVVTVAGSLAADRVADWRAGRRVRMPVQLRRPSRYLDPGVPDHERALARRGTTLVGTVKSAALVDVLERGPWFDEALSAARAFARGAIARGVGRWSGRSAAIVAAIVIGDRAGLDDEVERRLQEAGTYHVIAISGGNIAILAALLLGAFRAAGRLGRTAMLSSIAVLLLYAQFVGNGASVDRATLMAVVYFTARAFDQRSPPLNALALVAALLVAADPLSVADPAFVLTFGATVAILVVAPALTTASAAAANGSGRARTTALSASMLGVRRVLWSMCAASAAAEALLFPVGALVFSRVTFAGLALNFAAIPLMALAQIAGLAVVPLAVVSTAAAAGAGWLAHAGAAGLVYSADLVRFAPAAAYRIAPPPWLVVALYYVAALAAWTLWTRRRRLTGSAEPRLARRCRVASLAIAVAAAVWILVNPLSLAAVRGDGDLHLTFIDVGQGDAIFIVFPHGSTMVVDAGGLSAAASFDIGDRVVAPVIRDAGFRRLDYLVLTHGDPDHIGGAPSILREFRPREVWEGIPVPRFGPLTALRVAAQEQGARWANVYDRDQIVVDGVEILARHPQPADWERQKVRNDDSIVLELRWRDVSVLLTGDIGREIEKAIAPTLRPARIRILKVAHHGSLTSSARDFVQALRPQLAVVSAGRSNHFGHPVPEVLERYRVVGTEIFRTDRDGAVTMHTDGHALEVQTSTRRHLVIH